MTISRSILVVTALVLFCATAFWYFYDPYKPLHETKAPATLVDDLNRDSLIAAAQTQLHYLEGLPGAEMVSIGPYFISNSWLQHSLEEVVDFLYTNPNDIQLEQFIRTNYQFFQAGGRKHSWGRKMLVTGYYEPLFEGSLTKKPPYLTPLYSLPPDLKQIVTSADHKQVGRYDEQKKFLPFWTRQEIETQDHLAGNELVYLKDPFDAYLLHVQGSGKIKLPNGSVRALGFAGTNGHPYKSIGKHLVDAKIMKLSDVSIPAIRSYLEEHPEELLPLLHKNPRYIFFKWRNDTGPVGSIGEPLTPGRSIAIDPQSLPTGALAYLKTQKPIIGDNQSIISWQPMQRLVFPQDSGSAIKGTGRVDVFWGAGDYAEAAANNMKHPGELYFLVKKGFQTLQQ
jgi:membrane-bound lytic murein transglycosylase A